MRILLCLLTVLIVVSCNKGDQKSSDSKEKQQTEQKETELFVHHDAEASNLKFRNTVKETYEENYLNYEFLYNGSGVAVGDINNDGLPDIYFAGNSADDKLYLNDGDLKFQDISQSAGISELQGWSTGVTMVDINADGWLDIYVCRSGPSSDIANRTNRLYINNKDNTFTEAAKEFGLANTNYSIQSAFFDYDLDGDLDMYLLNHPDPKFKPKQAKEHMEDMKSGKVRSDNFYENDNGTFVEKSEDANLVHFGYRHGIAIGDINSDGYPDIYISSDFEEPDVLAINQGNKTFQNEIDSYFSHISYNSMGNEMVDINNDGLLDIYVVDMAPSDHFRSKAYMKSMDVDKFRGLKRLGYHSQYMFNTFQLNNAGEGYSEVAQYSGTAKTDWSWAPLFFDMDHDGDKDLFITNGIKENFLFRDINTEMNKRKRAGMETTLNDLLEIVPSDISENIFYKNVGGAKFKNLSGKWAKHSLYNSNGVATADFDNDGDLDFVTNNMDAYASLYESKATDIKKYKSLKVVLEGSSMNPQAIGAKVELDLGDGKMQYHELYTSRGYLSSVDTPLVFGLGEIESANITVTWPDGKISSIPGATANKTHTISYSNSSEMDNSNTEKENLFQLTTSTGLDFQHSEDNFDDYTVQILLPHSQSNVGPSITKGDVNGDGLEDLFIGGAAGQSGALYMQSSSGNFSKRSGPWSTDAAYEDTAAVFFDSDNDGDQDLYVVSGGAHVDDGSDLFIDRLYINNGDGNFTRAEGLIPEMKISGQGIAAADIDNDGDTDLFIGGRIIPDRYPEPVTSYFLVNEDGTFNVKELAVNQMVAKALFTDYDLDGDMDLITVGEWSPIKVFNNDNGEFSEANIPSLENTTGLWFGLAQHDIDGDGDMDYFAGNIGRNTKFKVGGKKEFHIYANDFDDNGTFDVVLSGTYKGSLVPSRGRECSSQQMPFIKDKFKDYRSFASATLEDIYGERLLQSLHYQADLLHSVFIENKGNGEFSITELPWESQLSPLSGFEFVDIDGDGSDEIFTVGNLYNVEVETVRYDASFGTIMSYSNGEFGTIHPEQTGFITRGDTRDVAALETDGRLRVLVSTNNGGVQVFERNN